MVIKIILGAFVVSWIWIAYEILTCPILDEDGNEIE
jgi:hypothetical protein